MIRVILEPMESNDVSNTGPGWLMSLEIGGRNVMSSTTQAYANAHDPIELAERAFGYGKGTSDASDVARGWPEGTAQEPVELVIKWLTKPTETRRLR